MNNFELIDVLGYVLLVEFIVFVGLVCVLLGQVLFSEKKDFDHYLD